MTWTGSVYSYARTPSRAAGTVPRRKLRRPNAAGLDVRITIILECAINDKTKNVLALDLNAGYTDFAALDKSKGTLLAIGKINHHETTCIRKRRRDALVYKMTENR